MLHGKTIIVGVTGGIAAYKAAEIVSRLKTLGADVWVVETGEAQKLVAPLTFRTLSGNPVITDLFEQELSSLPVPHIALAQKADLILIAPCTANVIGKIAGGIADDALTTLVMASSAQKLIAPAMNCAMWRNPVLQENVRKLGVWGFDVIGPNTGKLACGGEDIGRLAEPEEIVAKLVGLLAVDVEQDLKGKRILITAGGTREAIDPVRYISNRSSGKMGYALAEAAARRGAEVTLISAPTQLKVPEGIKIVNVVSAREMYLAVMEHKNNQDVIIMTAAVADYQPTVTLWQKLKKEEDTFQLDLSRTIDILAELGKSKNGSFLVGFAAETENHLENAREKMEKKNLDLIVVNDVEAFEADDSEAQIMGKTGGVKSLPRLSKLEIAHKVIDAIVSGAGSD